MLLFLLPARKKLIDSVRVTRDFAGWIRLDIVEAVKFWFRRPQHNFGIEISVQDERRRTYTAAEVIANVNCSGDGTCAEMRFALRFIHSHSEAPGVFRNGFLGNCRV